MQKLKCQACGGALQPVATPTITCCFCGTSFTNPVAQQPPPQQQQQHYEFQQQPPPPMQQQSSFNMGHVATGAAMMGLGRRRRRFGIGRRRGRGCAAGCLTFVIIAVALFIVFSVLYSSGMFDEILYTLENF